METTQQTLRIPHLGKRAPAIERTTVSVPGSTKEIPVVTLARTPQPTTPRKTYSSEELFGDQRDLNIEHRGEIYSLRITSFGRLILTK